MADALTASAIRPLPFVQRWSLRCRADAVATIGDALGLALPDAMCRMTASGRREALRLGPDEWTLRAPEGDAGWVAPLGGAMAGKPFSLVDISHRQVTILIAGPKAAAILSAGCPLDLDIAAFPVGMCTRTIFAKAEILLWRTDEGFVVEYWRSFADYLGGLLAQAESDAAF